MLHGQKMNENFLTAKLVFLLAFPNGYHKAALISFLWSIICTYSKFVSEWRDPFRNLLHDWFLFFEFLFCEWGSIFGILCAFNPINQWVSPFCLALHIAIRCAWERYQQPTPTTISILPLAVVRSFCFFGCARLFEIYDPSKCN